MARKTAKKATSGGPGRDLQAPAASRVEMWPIGRPKPYEHNPRQNDQAVAAVARSIQEFGFRQPIVVDGAGVIIAGHTRLKAAKKLGIPTVPVMDEYAGGGNTDPDDVPEPPKEAKAKRGEIYQLGDRWENFTGKKAERL